MDVEFEKGRNERSARWLTFDTGDAPRVVDSKRYLWRCLRQGAEGWGMHAKCRLIYETY